MWVKKQQDMERPTGSKLGKEYDKAVYYHPVYLTYIKSASCEILGQMSYKLELRLLGEVSTISDMLDNITLMAENRGTKEPLDEGERGE